MLSSHQRHRTNVAIIKQKPLRPITALMRHLLILSAEPGYTLRTFPELPVPR